MVYLIDSNSPKKLQVLNVVLKELKVYDYNHIVFSSPNVEDVYDYVFPNIQTVFVSDADGEIPTEEELSRLKENDIICLTGHHNIESIYHSASQKFRTIFPSEIMASTVKDLGISVQKCVEIAVLAADKKIVPLESRIISICGETDEPDTAVVLKPNCSNRMIDTKIIKILCHPYHREW